MCLLFGLGFLLLDQIMLRLALKHVEQMVRWELGTGLLVIGTICALVYRVAKERDEAFRRLVDESPASVLIGCDGEWLYLNESARRMLGATTKSDVQASTAAELFPLEGGDLDGQVNRQANGQSVEKKLRRLDGEWLDVEVRSMPILYQRQPADYLVINDITELKRSRSALQQTDKLTLLGELAAGIAHEIRNPLTSLRGFVQLFQVNHQDQGEQEYFKIMLSEIDRINLIVGELLLIAKPKEYEMERKDLRKMLETIRTILNTQAILYNIELHLVFQVEDDPLWVVCEENKLKQVFLNLVKNAIEAMPSGGQIWLEVSQEDDMIVVQVIDQGCGIPHEVLPKLGQAFFTRKDQGTGLGLMICFGIVKHHQGRMNIESEVGRGTRVEVALPCWREIS